MSTTYTVGQLATRFGISRSTLLYYDRKGLLRPSARSDANYRRYDDNDVRRLQQIRLYREAGLKLAQIDVLLDAEPTRISDILRQRLAHANDEIAQLRRQQQMLLDLLGKDSLRRSARTVDRYQWSEMLAASGMSERDMQRWHGEFERSMPQAHQDFLESLGIPEDEVAGIREKSRGEWLAGK